MKFIPKKFFKAGYCIYFLIVFLLLTPICRVKALTLTPIKLEISGDPGEVLTEQITLINETKNSETFYTSYENFEAQGETGTPEWLTPVDDIGTWMKSATSVSLLPGQQKNVPFTISIPKDAEPGGHFGGIFWGTTPKIQPGGQVAIGAKTGVVILLSVSGHIDEKGGILEFSTIDQKNFYTALPIDFYYRFENSGSDRIKPSGQVAIKNMFGITTTNLPGNPVDGNILPRSIRRIQTSWVGSGAIDPNNQSPQQGFFEQAKYEWQNFACGHYYADLNLVYGTSNQIAFSSVGFWVFPWQLLIIFIILLVLSFILIRFVLRRYNKWVIGRAEKMFEEREAQMHHIQKKTVLHRVVGPKIKKK